MNDLYRRLVDLRKHIDEYIELHSTVSNATVGEGIFQKNFDVLEDECINAAPQMEEKLLKSCSCPDLDDFLEHREESFSQMILRLIDERNLKDSEVYKRANIDRRLFSRLRSDEDYVPSKKTAISFCFALHLDLEQASALLETAGYSLSSSSRFDLIIMYLLEHKEFSIEFANIVLNDYGEGTLSR